MTVLQTCRAYLISRPGKGMRTAFLISLLVSFEGDSIVFIRAGISEMDVGITCLGLISTAGQEMTG